MKICIVASGQPSTNPRTVKEAAALHAAGYNVTVIYTPISSWADKLDEEIFSKMPGVNWIQVGYSSAQQRMKYKLARLRRKMYDVLFKYNILIHRMPENAIALFSQNLKSKALQVPADLYIAHNLGALPAAVKAAKKYKSFVAFDAEDFHRGEDDLNTWHYKVSKSIEDINIPHLSYLTAASPLIGKRYAELYRGLNVTVVNNVFSKSFLQDVSPESNKQGLSLFWFSQIVGERRGLEDIVSALNILERYDITLHLLGNCSDDYKSKLRSLAKKPGNMFFLEQVHPDKIFSIASRFDIGIASEIPYCENRDICLTNKIFTYLLAGNCVLASNTTAQTKMLEENPGIGLLYNYRDVTDIADKLDSLYKNRVLLHNCKMTAHNLAASKYNWETESVKVLDIVNHTLSKRIIA